VTVTDRNGHCQEENIKLQAINSHSLRSPLDHINSIYLAMPSKMRHNSPLCLNERAKTNVPLILDAGGIRQRNDLIQLHPSLLGIAIEHVRANGVP
jgi:hypothetical protein